MTDFAFRVTKVTARPLNQAMSMFVIHECHRHAMLVLSDQRRTGPPTEPGFSQGFFSISVTEFRFLATVTFDLLSWGHLISSNIVNLIAQILFELDDDITE